MRSGRLPFLAALSGASVFVLLVVFASTGTLPKFRGLVTFESGGIVDVAPDRVTRVELRAGNSDVVLLRRPGGWARAGADAAVPVELGEHIKTGLRFLNVSKPSREIGSGELDPGRFAEFGLDPPARLVLLGTAEGPVAAVNLGALNPSGTAHYARLGGAATVYLLPRHVGGEWDIVKDMAGRLPGEAGPASADGGAALLSPVSMTQAWALEVVRAGAIARFERDGEGNWFRHTGQHNHAAGAAAHKADPAQARVIGDVLATLGETVIERRISGGADDRELADFGLAFPEIILLFYARDNPTPVARIELGDSAGVFDRYARLAASGEVVTIAEFEVRHLAELLKATEPES